MPKISIEGTIGLVLEIALGIADHLHVQEPLIVWGLFLLGLILISDAVIRSDWATNSSRPLQKQIIAMIPVVVVFAAFGWWIFGRTRQAVAPHPAQAQTQEVSPPKPQTAPIPRTAQPGSEKPSKVRVHIKQDGRHNVANPGIVAVPITQAPCSIAQIGGSGNQATANCLPPERKFSEKQNSAFVVALKPSCPFEVAVHTPSGNAESGRYADQIVQAIKAAGCTVLVPNNLLDSGTLFGIEILVASLEHIPQGALALEAAFQAAQIGFRLVPFPNNFVRPDQVYVIVGLLDESSSR